MKFRGCNVCLGLILGFGRKFILVEDGVRLKDEPCFDTI